MSQVVIENPVINSPFDEPTRHFRFSDEGITDEIVDGRRVSSYFVPIARPKKKGRQLTFDTEWTQDRIQENELINEIRRRVADGGRAATSASRPPLPASGLLDRPRPREEDSSSARSRRWKRPSISPRWRGSTAMPGSRTLSARPTMTPTLAAAIAFKMATGSGKTVVMAMLIAWQTLNKLANPQDARFSDTFLIVTPGITIRDRLRVLLPNDPQNYYRQHDLVPPDRWSSWARPRSSSPTSTPSSCGRGWPPAS